ncbi:uncharacterized protein LOC126817508 [Patella vulgata]|uniref:uncharacterized protein LOC126817508 n=1 Tax=Patella vulgata TaxID=6465 RepID=UPI0021805BA5|nr:uncharacterized protein LOC126817508 [Patella vulgata]
MAVAGHRKTMYTLFILILWVHNSEQACQIPKEYGGDWYSMETGVDTLTLVDESKFGNLECIERFTHKNEYNVDGVNSTMLMKVKEGEGNSKCFHCVDVLWRTINILQYRKSDCFTNNGGINMCRGKDKLPGVDQLATLFRQTIQTVNCISTFEGVYQFTYEVNTGGGGICNSEESTLEACQDPGSEYVDNEVFLMNYGKCPDVQTSKKQKIRYQCMGSWFAMVGSTGYTYAAIADTVEKDRRERFKCLLTLKNQKSPDNSIRWVMSRFADCSKLNSLYNGPVRLVLRLIPPLSKYTTPQCNLPRNISGSWFTQGLQFRSDVTLNETHIYYFTQKNQFEYEETYLSCQQTLGTRYLMTKVIVGKCEVDFVCYDILPRHHGIVRYRVGKPSRLTGDEIADTDYLEKKFREACSWVSFSFNRDDTHWKYEVLILNPPSPIPCPIAGRYGFNQKVSFENEKYETRIRGVTDRPRVQVDCRIQVSEFKSCSQDKSKIEIDAEYCESVDYRGRPVGEYDDSDHILTCVGYWMEDMKSFLITYDEEDAISAFRCWVYERSSWTDIVMSRAQTARCPRNQDAKSFDVVGTGLRMELFENERLFDDCPQRFDPGIDPYRKPMVIYVLSSANSLLSFTAILTTSLLTIFLVLDSIC